MALHLNYLKQKKNNATLSSIINQEHIFLSHQINNTTSDERYDPDMNFYDHLDDNLNYKIESQYQIETKYAWAHLSCANFIPEIEYTPKSALKVGKLLNERFEKI